MMHIANIQTEGNNHRLTIKTEIPLSDYTLFFKKFEFLKDISPVKIVMG